MNQISLLKVTVVVVISALDSSIVHADEIIGDIPAVKDKEVKQFSSIIIAFDTDKNGKLNESEILASRSKTLHKRLARIDLNADSEISHEELMEFLTLVERY